MVRMRIVGQSRAPRAIRRERYAVRDMFSRFTIQAALALSLAAGPLSDARLEWTLDLGTFATSPAVIRSGLYAVALASSKLAIFDGAGKKLREMPLDLPPATPAKAADVDRDGKMDLLVADMWGSIYRFDESGRRVWKYERQDRAGGAYNYIVLADLDGDRKSEIIFTTQRGYLFAIDHMGKLRFEAHVTNYRVSTPAVADVDGDGRPELIFGTDDSEIYCIDHRGALRWNTHLEAGRFGRTLPVVADADRDGALEVYVSTPFVGKGPGLYSLDAKSGKLRWKAPSELQSYNSIVIADLDGDGTNEILHGDKNTRLYAVSAAGKRLWITQFDGRGIFFTGLAIEVGGKRSFVQVARGAGVNGKTLYAVDGAGKTIDEIAIEGGGAQSPVLDGDRLLVASNSGRIHSFRFASAPRDLALRADPPDAGYRSAPGPGVSAIRDATPGINRLDLRPATPESHFWMRVTGPDGVTRVTMVAPGLPVRPRLEAAVAGDYRVETESGTLVYRLRTPAKIEADVPGAPVEVRQWANPWAEEEKTAQTNAISARMLGNEFESIALTITNRQARPMVVRLDCAPFGSVASKRVIEFRETPLVRVISTGRMSEDPLPRLADGNLLRLGPNESRKLWVTVNSRGLKAGEHKATLSIGDLSSLEPPLGIPVTLEVLPVRLPEEHVYRHNTWLYPASIADEEVREATIQDALEHGVNVMLIPSASVAADESGRVSDPDSKVHDTIAIRLRGKAQLMITGTVGIRWPKGITPAAEVEKKAFADAIRWYAGHMKQLGFDYRDWMFYPMDEPGLMGKDAAFDKWADGVKQIKEADPRVRVYANPAGGGRAEVLRPIAQWVDVWQPDLHLVREQPEALGAIFGKGEYWHYEACADQRNLDPLGYYRTKPWVAFQMGMTGGGYWVYSYSPYWLFDRSLGVEYGAVYQTDRGPVTSKRWEASRDGIEDFELLWMIREKAKSARNGAAALRLLDEAVAYVTKDQEKASDIARQVRPFAPDYSRWMQYRNRLIEALATLE